MSYPRTAHLFKAWTEAMLRNATVDKPDYGKKTRGTKTSKVNMRTKTRRKRRRKKRKNGSKD